MNEAGRWRRLGHRAMAIGAAGGAAASFFSWFGISPGAVAHWGAAISAAVVVAVLGGIWLLGLEEDRGVASMTGLVPTLAIGAALTCALAGLAGWLTFVQLRDWRGNEATAPGWVDEESRISLSRGELAIGVRDVYLGSLGNAAIFNAAVGETFCGADPEVEVGEALVLGDGHVAFTVTVTGLREGEEDIDQVRLEIRREERSDISDCRWRIGGGQYPRPESL